MITTSGAVNVTPYPETFQSVKPRPLTVIAFWRVANQQSSFAGRQRTMFPPVLVSVKNPLGQCSLKKTVDTTM
jgi:hypothetical protein